MIYTITCNPAWDITYSVPAVGLGLHRAYRSLERAGGKGVNVSGAIRKAGGECITAVVLAGETGERIERALMRDGESVIRFPGRGNTRCNVSLIGDDGKTLEINGEGAGMDPVCRQAVLDWMDSVLVHGDILCICGSLPPVLEAEPDMPSFYTTLCRRAASRGAMVVLDCAGAALTEAVWGQVPPALIKPNREELAALAGYGVEDDADRICDAAAEAVDLSKTAVLCTRGKNGAVWIDQRETIVVPALPVEKIQAEKGAGDTYLGTFLWYRYGLNQSIHAAMSAAAEAAFRLVAGK